MPVWSVFPIVSPKFVARLRRLRRRHGRGALSVSVALVLVVNSGCSGKAEAPLNSPYTAELAGQNLFFSAFSERPKHLDPARAYSENEMAFLGQIYEPPLQYHYLKRPYTLEPLTLQAMPSVRYLDAHGHAFPAHRVTSRPASERIARSVYRLQLKPGIRYQAHPALARRADGRARYVPIAATDLKNTQRFADFAETGTRELVAADYVHQIKRLADPRVASPIAGVMGEYIVGLNALSERLAAQLKAGQRLDLAQETLPGARVIDRYTWEIEITGTYPQFLYWLAMPFFAPVPPEADAFYAQPGMRERNFTLDWQPVGTGAFYLAENDPNRVMILRKNPNYHPDFYPAEGEAGDAAAGLLRDAGQRLPLLDAAIYTLEKEDIPYWNKFLQGYYDSSGIASDTFDQAIRIAPDGKPDLSPDLQARGIQLATAERPSLWYLGFNWLDPVVGGAAPGGQKLRQALSIALDWDEFISVFLNGRGLPAQGPIPPGIAGGSPAMERNDVVFGADGKRRRLAEARQRLAEAGYPNGRDARTGQPLTLYFDTMASGPEAKARLDWYRKQFARLDIQLVVRATDYNRFQDKMHKGNAQIFEWGWNADYPDAENFLFLLYGPNRKQGSGGENAANYQNLVFDRLFVQMKNLPDGPARKALIDQMLALVRHDAPWVFAYTPKSFGLQHAWMANAKPNQMAHNTLKYRRVDAAQRQRYQQQWNAPQLWPLAALMMLGLGIGLWAWRTWRQRQQSTALAPAVFPAAKG